MDNQDNSLNNAENSGPVEKLEIKLNDSLITDDGDSEARRESETTKALLKDYMAVMVPSCVFFVAAAVMQAYNIHKANQKYSPLEANAVGLAGIIFNLAGFSILVGFMGGFEVLGPNALGRKNPYLMGVYFHRSKIVGLIVALLAYFALFFFCKDIVSFFTIENVDLDALERYIIRYSLFIFPEIQSRACYNYLNMVKKSEINLYAMIASVAVHIGAVEVMVEWMDMGLDGIAFAIVINVTFNAIFLTVYISVWKPSPESIFWLNADCFKDLKAYFAFSFPNTVLLCSEWWAWEILCFMVSKVGKLEYNAHISIASLGGIVFSFTIGLCQGLLVNVSKLIAEGKLEGVKRIAKISIIMSTIIIGAINIILFFLRDTVFGWYIHEEDVLEIALKYSPLIFLQQMIDIYQTLENTYMKALGKQCLASGICIANFYCIQTFLIWFFGLHLEYGLIGIYLSFIFSTFTGGVFYTVFIVRFDLREIYKETKERLAKAESAIHDDSDNKLL